MGVRQKSPAVAEDSVPLGLYLLATPFSTFVSRRTQVAVEVKSWGSFEKQ